MRSKLSHQNPRERGFTLLEVLVVLVITALVSAVLMQGMGLVLGLRDNLGEKLLDLDQLSLERNRVLLPLEGLVPDFDDGDDKFEGVEGRVSGLTLKPLLRREGRPTRFAINLLYDESSNLNTLVYQEGNDPVVTLSSWEGGQARFRYIGVDGEWVESWPQKSAPIQLGVITEIRPPQLPDLILLDTQSSNVPDFAVAILARRMRMPRDPPI
jgi:prepilin-type N-terminal cleavage/methylation domain-containing protein